MYVRRKCYSILEDIDGVEKLFSVNEIEDVNDIENILYDEERYFSEEDEKGGLSTAAKAGIGTVAGLGSLAGLTYAAKKGMLGSKARGLYDQAAKKSKDVFESIKGKFGKKEAQAKGGLSTAAKAGLGSLAGIAAAVGLSKTKFGQALKGKFGPKAKAMAEKIIKNPVKDVNSKINAVRDKINAKLEAKLAEYQPLVEEAVRKQQERL